MTYKTHRRFAVCWVFVASIILYKFGVSKIGYYPMLIIMLSAGQEGAKFPDKDHDWKNVKDKTALNYIINKVIHLTGGKHRSWQTHSLDIWIYSAIVTLFINRGLYKGGTIDVINYEVIMIILVGFFVGWLSHLVSDMLTSAGIRLTFLRNRKIAFVPQGINKTYTLGVGAIIIAGGIALILLNVSDIGTVMVLLGICSVAFFIRIGDMRFNTGDVWEESVYKAMGYINCVTGVIALIYPFMDNIIA